MAVFRARDGPTIPCNAMDICRARAPPVKSYKEVRECQSVVIPLLSKNQKLFQEQKNDRNTQH